MLSACWRSGPSIRRIDSACPSVGGPARGAWPQANKLIQFLRVIRYRNDWAAVGILTAAVLLRLAFASLVYARPSLAVANDSDRYVPIASSILSGHAYAWNTDRPGELLNTAGYPLFLAGTFAVLGRSAGDIAVAQLTLSAMLALALYFAVHPLVGTAPALAAALLLAVDPLTILWSMTILTEVLFAAVLGISGLLLVRWAHSGRTRTLLLAGFFAGLACLVKPYAELVVAVWGLALIFLPDGTAAREQLPIALGPRRLLVFLVPVVLLVAPWFVRNALLWHCPALSSVDRVTMRDYVAAKVISETEHISLEQAQLDLQTADPGICPVNGSSYLKTVLAHAGLYAQLHVAGTLPVLFGTSFDRWLQYTGTDYRLPDLFQPFMDHGVDGVVQVLGKAYSTFPAAVALMAGLILFQVLIYWLALRGACRMWHDESAVVRWTAITTVAAILVLVLAPGQGGHERFRVPAQPFLMLLAAYGLLGTSLLQFRRPGKVNASRKMDEPHTTSTTVVRVGYNEAQPFSGDNFRPTSARTGLWAHRAA